jgi:Bacterial regulatory proteins, tetR family
VAGLLGQDHDVPLAHARVPPALESSRPQEHQAQRHITQITTDELLGMLGSARLMVIARVSCPGTGGTVSTAKTDRRVRRTRELLRRALFSLIQEQGYDRITVQDLLDRADIGRSTFYAHYRDKDDLLLSSFEDIRSTLAAERKAAEQTTGAPSGFLQPLLVVFRHVEGHRHLWQPLVS